MAIKAFIFDLDNTLFDHKKSTQLALESFFHLYPILKKSYVELEKFQLAWNNAHSIFFAKFLVGDITYEEQKIARIRAVWAKAGLAVSDKAALTISQNYVDLYESFWCLFPDTLDCLQRLKKNKLGLITNGWSDQQRKKLIRFNLLDKFQTIVISSEVDCAKPDPKIFKLACEQLSVNPSEAVYVGDTYDIDIAGAETAGLQPLWLLREADIIVDSSLNIPRIHSLSELA